MRTEFTRPISRPARLVDYSESPSGTELNTQKTKVECIFFPRFHDREETFSLDVLALDEGGNDDDDLNDDDAYKRSNLVVTFFRTSGCVSRPKVVVYDNWYQRAKEALTTTMTSTLSGRRGVDVPTNRYQFSIEEKTKKNTGDDAEEKEVFELVWRFSENDENEESREEEEDAKKKRGEMVMMRGSCKMKRVVVAAARAAEGVETGSAKDTATVLLELLRHASLKYIREKEGNVDLKRANECLRKDQEIAVKEELEKARDIEQFKRKCFEECLVLVNEKKKRIRELEEILETARKENDALRKKIGKGKGGKKRGRSSSSFTSSSSEASSSSEELSDEDEEEEANTDDEDKDTQIRKRMRQTAMVDTIKTTSDGRKKPSAKPTTTKVKTTTKAAASQKSKPAARRVNTFDALMQANLGRDSDANSQSSSF